MNNFRYFHKFHLGNWTAYALFFLMLFTPFVYQHIKAVLLGLLMVMIAVRIFVRGKLSLHQTVFLWTLLIVIIAFISVLVGIINDTPGALIVAHVFVLYPLVFTLIITGITELKMFDGLFRVIIFSTIAIGSYTLAFLFNSIGYLPDKLFFHLDQGQGIGFHPGFFEYSLYNITTLPFLVPFLFTALVTWRKPNIVSRFWLWVAFLLSIIISILSGRKGLWIAIVLAPLILFVIQHGKVRKLIFKKQYKSSILRTSLILIIFLMVIYFPLQHTFRFDAAGIMNDFTSGFDDSSGATARKEQLWGLLTDWSKKPLLGWGHGAFSPSSPRRDVGGWGYELLYVDILFKCGIVGFLTYFFWFVWMFRKGLIICYSDEKFAIYLQPVLVGSICFLVASASNPYLATFDYMFVIFLPMALINYWLLSRHTMNDLK